MLLEALKIYDIPITDWISSIGILIALPAGVWSAIKLFKKDKEKTAQIESLIKLSEQSVNQTKQLAYQVNEMQESNKLLERQIIVFEKYFSLTKEQIDLDNERLTLENEKRIKDNKPNFHFDGLAIYFDGEIGELMLTNKGEEAIFINFELNEKNSFQVNLVKMNNASNNKKSSENILKNDYITIELSPSMPGLTVSQCYASFNVVYSDIERNKYRQLVEGKAGEIIVSPPELYQVD